MKGASIAAQKRPATAQACPSFMDAVALTSVCLSCRWRTA